MAANLNGGMLRLIASRRDDDDDDDDDEGGYKFAQRTVEVAVCSVDAGQTSVGH